jgi:TRAP-type uncharacterized transport system substrate-binding protein
VIPAGTYGKDMPETKSFQDSCILSTNADLPEDLIYAITKTIWSKEGLETLLMAHKAAKETTMENGFDGASVQLHPGAAKFWAEQGKSIPDKLKP